MADQEIIRVFPRKTKWTPTDDLAFVGEPPLYDLPNLPVHISVVFTWDREKGTFLVNSWSKRCKDVRIGGPAFGDYDGEFVPGRFIMEGLTITSRGCPKQCLYCLVPHDGKRPIELKIKPGHRVQDDNLLACSRGHIEKVFEMLETQKGIIFSGGLDIDYLEPWHVDLLKKISLDEIWVSCDRQEDLKRLDKAKDLLSDFSIEKRRCYVMIGFDDESLEEMNRRCEQVYDNERGFLPFVMPYKSPDAEFSWCGREDWMDMAKMIKKWSRPAIYRSKKKF